MVPLLWYVSSSKYVSIHTAEKAFMMNYGVGHLDAATLVQVPMWLGPQPKINKIKIKIKIKICRWVLEHLHSVWK
jgi:hypothetical protein